MAAQVSDWARVEIKNRKSIHHAAHDAWRHRSGWCMVLLWFGWGVEKPTYLWRLMLDKTWADHAGEPQTPPLSWAEAVLRARGKI